MPYIKWGGKKIYLEKPKPYVPDINELMKPLSEKVNKGNIWGSIIMKVPTPEVFKFDPDYQAVLDYASTLSGVTLPEYSQQLLQNQLVIDLKDGGIWNKLDTFGVFATNGNDIFALVDWKRLTTYTPVSSPTFTINEGFQGNGTSSYIDTNFNPVIDGVNHTLDNASRYYLHFSGSSNIVDGIDLTGANQALSLSNSLIQRINSTNSLNAGFTYTTTKGIKSIHRTSSTNVTLFNDKIGDTRTQTSTVMPSNNQFVLRRFVNYSANKTWGYAMGASLVSENDAFVDALTNYINSI